MFCSNCGSELASGSKFCSECGTRVEDNQAKDLVSFAFDEAIGATEALASEPVKPEEAFKERVSFDWSNVIDEPQKKEIPQGIKSPWAATSDSITERELYSEMTQSDDKNRTLNFIDVLKADKEERERAARGKSIEYTEVLELDPEVIGGTKPPKLRYAPLYDDVDAPVKTPFDDIPVSAANADNQESADVAVFEVPATEPSEDRDKVEAASSPRREAPKFEMPGFLKKAVGFGSDEAAKEETQAEREAVETIAEAVAELKQEESAAQAFETPREEEPVAQVFEAQREEALQTSTTEIFKEEETQAEREAVETIAEAVAELKQEERAAQAFETHKEESAALTTEIFKEEETQAEREVVETIAEAAVELKEKEPVQVFEAPKEEPATQAFEASREEADVKAASEPAATDNNASEAEDFYLDESFYLDIEESSPATQRMSRVDAHTLAGAYDDIDLFDAEEDAAVEADILDDGEQAIDEKDLFAEMSETPAGHTGMTIAAPADEEEEIEALKRRLSELTGAVDMGSEGDSDDTFESFGSDFTFEPEVTPADDALFAELTPAREAKPKAEEPKLAEDRALEDFMFEPAPTQIQTETQTETQEMPSVQDLKIDAPAPILSDSQKKAFEGLVFDFPQAEPAPEAERTPIFDATTETASKAEETLKAGEAARAVETLIIEETPKAEESLKADEAPEADGTPKFDEAAIVGSAAKISPIIGFAPAITESADFGLGEEAQTAEEPQEPAKEDLEKAAEPVATPAEPAVGAAGVETLLIKESVPEAQTAQAEPVPVVRDVADVENVAAKVSDAVSFEDLEKELFGEVSDDAEPETTKKIDKFYTLYRKNEEFQRLLDEEYSRLKGENIQIPEEEEAAAVTETATEAETESSPVALTLDDFANDGDAGLGKAAVKTEAVSDSLSDSADVKPAFGLSSEAEATTAVLEELTQGSRPVEDATIYRVGMPETSDLSAKQAEPAANTGFSVDLGNEADKPKSLGLDGTEIAGAAVAGAAAAGAAEAVSKAGSATDAAGEKLSKKEAKKAEREAKKAAKKAKKEEAKKGYEEAAKKALSEGEEPQEDQADYEEIDGGSTFLTIFAVLVALLLVVLLAVILVLHIAPDSGIAMAIDRIIENITSKFSDINSFGGYRLL